MSNMKRYERALGLSSLDDLEALSRILGMCQWDGCESTDLSNGTGFCAEHIGPARERACEEMRTSYGMCALDNCDGQADGSKEEVA